MEGSRRDRNSSSMNSASSDSHTALLSAISRLNVVRIVSSASLLRLCTHKHHCSRVPSTEHSPPDTPFQPRTRQRTDGGPRATKATTHGARHRQHPFVSSPPVPHITPDLP